MPTDAMDVDDDGRRLSLPGATWSRVSPKLVWAEVVTVLVIGVVITAGCVLLGVALSGVARVVWVALAGVTVVVVALVAGFTPRRIRAIGYLLRDDDLVVRRGLMWQRFTAVPYGRMQLIDVSRGPLERALGISELRFVTAAVATNVRLPGLPAQSAEELRDRLVELAESRRVGL